MPLQKGMGFRRLFSRKFRRIVTTHTESTKGAVSVIIFYCTPNHCKKMDISMESTLRNPDCRLLFPTAEAHKLPNITVTFMDQIDNREIYFFRI